MRALLDVNMLLAAFDAGHVHHPIAMGWWAANSVHGWASCPLAENGFLRIVSQKSYRRPTPLPDALAVLRRQIAASDHAFWPDDVSILDSALIDHSRLLGPRQITDIYLLALAVKNGGRLVTLDTSIAWRAVQGAEPRHLVTLI